MVFPPLKSSFLSSVGTILLIWHSTSLCVAAHEFLIMTQPTGRQVSYLRRGEDNVRPLINTGLVSPTSVAVDKVNMRLFVSDSASGAIYWYQLQKLADHTLITDGIQRTAVTSVATDDIAVDQVGDLYFSGTVTLPAPFTMPHRGIFRHSALALARNRQVDPALLWDRGFSGMHAWAPGPLRVDVSYIYWGNGDGGMSHGSVIRGPSEPAHMAAPRIVEEKEVIDDSPTFGVGDNQITNADFLAQTYTTPPAPIVVPISGPAHNVELYNTPLPGVSTATFEYANNVNSVRGIANSAKFLFYSANNAVYGVSKARGTQKCVNATDCAKVTQDAARPAGLVWDGDGTIYIADEWKANEDGSNGGLYSIPSGALDQEHMLNPISPVPGIRGVAYVKFGFEQERGSALRQGASLSVMIGISAFFTLAMVV